jgi:hypothetical protein
MLEITEKLRPNSLIIPYPNYHKGDYFEEYFFKRFIKEYPNCEINGLKYIPIFWTNCYTNKVFNGNNYDIQNVLNSLDQNDKYFTISQHDDCVYEKLPDNTLIFSMGGNKTGDNIIPIPLICSPINKNIKDKSIKASFVGSLTHPLRIEMYNYYKNDIDFTFFIKNWSLDSGASNVSNFMDIMSKSYYTLAPRGYGKTSFRLYEAMQLDSIPVYIYDEPWLPWTEYLDWSKFCVLIDKNNISNIKEMLKNTDYDKMIHYKNEIYNDYFTYEGVYINIIKKIKNGNI